MILKKELNCGDNNICYFSAFIFYLLRIIRFVFTRDFENSRKNLCVIDNDVSQVFLCNLMGIRNKDFYVQIVIHIMNDNIDE